MDGRGRSRADFRRVGGDQVRDLEAFRGAVTNYRLIPEWLATPFAWTAPVIESAAALGLLLSPTRASAALGVDRAAGLFTGAIAINLARGRTDIDCGCFGPALRQGLSWWLLLAQSAFYSMLARDRADAGGRAADGFARPRDRSAWRAATVVMLYTSRQLS